MKDIYVSATKSLMQMLNTPIYQTVNPLFVIDFDAVTNSVAAYTVATAAAA